MNSHVTAYSVHQSLLLKEKWASQLTLDRLRSVLLPDVLYTAKEVYELVRIYQVIDGLKPFDSLSLGIRRSWGHIFRDLWAVCELLERVALPNPSRPNSYQLITTIDEGATDEDDEDYSVALPLVQQCLDDYAQFQKSLDKVNTYLKRSGYRSIQVSAVSSRKHPLSILCITRLKQFAIPLSLAVFQPMHDLLDERSVLTYMEDLQTKLNTNSLVGENK